MSQSVDNKKPLLLIVDDEDDFREVLKARLLFEGFDVIDTENPVKAFDIALNEKPNLVIMDLMMPEMSGYQVWSQFQKNATLKHIPMIILTAKNQATDTFWGTTMSPFDYITKPYKIEALLSRIEEKIHPKSDKKP